MIAIVTTHVDENTYAWEQRRLGDHLSLSGEKNGALRFGVNDVYSVSWTEGVVNQIEFQGRSFAGSDLSGYDVVHFGDVIYTKSPLGEEPYGIVKANKGRSGIVSQLYAVFHPMRGASSLFIEAYFSLVPRLNSYFRPLVNKGAKNTMNISDEMSLEGMVVFPGTREQRNIGALFSRLDDLIALHQRKCDGLKTVKKALLEKMFPRDGETAPEIRFAGFTDAWEQRRLGDFGHVAMCKRIYKEQTSNYGDVPFFKIGTFGSEPDAFITDELYEQYRSLYPYPGTLLISAAGSIGRIVEYKGERAYYQDSNIVWLEHNDELDDSCLKQSLTNVTWTLEGSTIKRLYNKDIMGKQIAVPSVPEQRAIGALFSLLDGLIALHQRKLDALKNVKKSLLEGMFV